MTWARIDDGFCDHPKVVLTSYAARGLWATLISYAARHRTEGFINAQYIRTLPRAGARSLQPLLVELVAHRLLEKVDGGYQLHDFLDYNPSRDELDFRRQRDSRRRELGRDVALRAAIHDRDGDHCRYCDRIVNWNDRRGPKGGTYDHVDPDGPNTLPNVVTACRGCSSAKADRMPQAANMPLLPPRGAQMDIVVSVPHPKGRSKSDSDYSLASRVGVGGVKDPRGGFTAEDEDDARAPMPEIAAKVDAAIAVLDRAPRLRPVFREGVEAAVAAHPAGDAAHAAAEVVTWVSDPAFRIENSGKLLWDALERQAARANGGASRRPPTGREAPHHPDAALQQLAREHFPTVDPVLVENTGRFLRSRRVEPTVNALSDALRDVGALATPGRGTP